MESKERQEDAPRSTQERPLLPLNKDGTAPETKKNSLAYLDGLRGVAALLVYLHHHITEYYGSDCDLMHAWGYKDRRHFGQLPFIQLFFCGGTPAVMLFFVLSGYVLSRGVFQMLQNNKTTTSIHKYLLNALLRRPIRLWLPPILVSLPVAFAFQSPLRPVGAYIVYQNGLARELKKWLLTLIETVNPFIGHGPFLQAFEYDPPVWTMAYELNGSVLVYAFLAIVAPFLVPRHRMMAMAVTTFIAFEYGHFSLVPFVLGMMLAQMDVAKLDESYIELAPEHRRSTVFNAFFVVGWYLLSDVGPVEKSEHPWFGLPANWIPYFFYHNTNFATNIIGACFMVYACLRLPWLQQLFNRAQWLGRVSFGLYLTHVPIMWIFALRVQRFFGKELSDPGDPAFFDGWVPIPDVGPQGMTTRYLASQAVVLPFNLLLAEFVTRWIDEPSVTVSKQFASKVIQRLHLG